MTVSAKSSDTNEPTSHSFVLDVVASPVESPCSPRVVLSSEGPSSTELVSADVDPDVSSEPPIVPSPDAVDGATHIPAKPPPAWSPYR